MAEIIEFRPRERSTSKRTGGKAADVIPMTARETADCDEVRTEPSEPTLAGLIEVRRPGASENE